MKVVIFAGGKGTRLSEETQLKPKPMVEIGGKPILWHIMKIYAAHGHNEFIICLGYLGYAIKAYFLNYFMHNADITVDLKNNNIEVHNSPQESFKITLVDTGLETYTAGRLKRVEPYLNGEEFMLTYGDGLSDINISALVEYHKSHDKILTVTAIQPNSRFGIMQINEDQNVMDFVEKPTEEGNWINGGFFVLKPEVFKYLHDDADHVMWERQPMEDLAKNNQIVAYKHTGFWKCMDNLRDKNDLNHMWEYNPQWKVW